MTIYYSIIDKRTVRIHLRFESEEGDIGEGFEELHPGEEFSGVTFEQFVANGSGEIEI